MINSLRNICGRLISSRHDKTSQELAHSNSLDDEYFSEEVQEEAEVFNGFDDLVEFSVENRDYDLSCFYVECKSDGSLATFEFKSMQQAVLFCQYTTKNGLSSDSKLLSHDDIKDRVCTEEEKRDASASFVQKISQINFNLTSQEDGLSHEFDDSEIRAILIHHYNSLVMNGGGYLKSYGFKGNQYMVQQIVEQSMANKNIAIFDLWFEKPQRNVYLRTRRFFDINGIILDSMMDMCIELEDYDRLKETLAYTGHEYDYASRLDYDGKKDLNILRFCIDNNLVIVDMRKIWKFYANRNGMKSLDFLTNNLPPTSDKEFGAWSYFENEWASCGTSEKDTKFYGRNYYFQDIISFKEALFMKWVGRFADIGAGEILEYIESMSLKMDADTRAKILKKSGLADIGYGATIEQIIHRISEAVDPYERSQSLDLALKPKPPDSKKKTKI